MHDSKFFWNLFQVPCPSIFDPAEKYMSLIVPAYNEEYRLHGALEETIKYFEALLKAFHSFQLNICTYFLCPIALFDLGFLCIQPPPHRFVLIVST